MRCRGLAGWALLCCIPWGEINGGGGFEGYLLPSPCSCSSICDTSLDFCLFAASLGGVARGRRDCFCCLLCGGLGEQLALSGWRELGCLLRWINRVRQGLSSALSLCYSPSPAREEGALLVWLSLLSPFCDHQLFDVAGLSFLLAPASFWIEHRLTVDV